MYALFRLEKPETKLNIQLSGQKVVELLSELLEVLPPKLLPWISLL